MLVYLVVVIATGAFLYRGQRTPRDYFLAGRSMGWLMVTLSIFCTGFSSIGFIGSAGVGYKRDLILFSAMFNMPVVTLILLTVLMPFFYKLNLYTAYEYLEERFDLKTRALASGLFLFMRSFLTATMLYATALVFSETLNVSLFWTALALGLVCTYTVLGGIKAVMIIDCIQFFIINIGALAALVTMIASIDGGFIGTLREASVSGRLRLFDWSFHLYGNEYDSWNCIIGLFFANLASFGVDQTMMQRNLTSKTYEVNRRATIMTPVFCVPLSLLFYFLGTALFVYYQQHPGLVDPNIAGDRVLVHYVLTRMPSGLRALMIAAIFAAAITNIDSAFNSLATVTTVDFIDRFNKKGQKLSVGWARAITIFWGVFSTALALFWVYRGGLSSVLENAIVIGSFSSGPLLAIFLGGMLFRRLTANGAFYGSVVGLFMVCWTEFLPRLAQTYHWDLPRWLALTGGIHSFWYGALGFLSTMLFGSVISWFGSAPSPAEVKGLVVGEPILDRGTRL
jgi:SSS family transporter